MEDQNLTHNKIIEYWNNTLKSKHLRELLNDEQRNNSLVSEFDGITLDYSHEKVDHQVLDLFEQLASETQIYKKIEAMFSGEKINYTENRAVLHVALRAKPEEQIIVDNKNVVEDVYQTLGRIEKFSEQVRAGLVKGFTGKVLSNVVVIGIGGSYLGIEFIHEALRTHHIGVEKSKGRKLRFLANVDPVDFQRAIEGLDVQETLFLINSKTFTTAETMMNAKVCKQWILDSYANSLGEQTPENQKAQVLAHICAVSTNLIETSKFGLADEFVFGFWDWVGGRYSVCSAIGVLPLSLQYGFQYVRQFLNGANSMDQHFRNTHSVKNNLPLLLGVISWYRTSIQNSQTIALLPYSQALNRFAAHIQQLSMESNGKQALLVNENASKYLQPADAVIFGEPGTNSQHSFFQLLHQGKNIIPCEFIGYARSQSEFLAQTASQKASVRDQHDELMSNFFAQVDALALGKTPEQVRADGVPENLVHHKVFPGDRGSIQILFRDEVNPYNLGQLLALYEHRVAVQGFLWNINSFDQWGVELGKVLAKNVREVLKKNVDASQAINFGTFNSNSGTKNLISRYRTYQN